MWNSLLGDHFWLWLWVVQHLRTIFRWSELCVTSVPFSMFQECLLHPTVGVQHEAAKSFGSLAFGLPEICDKDMMPFLLKKLQSQESYEVELMWKLWMITSGKWWCIMANMGSWGIKNTMVSWFLQAKRDRTKITSRVQHRHDHLSYQP